MRKKLSRRDFARTSALAGMGAAAVGLSTSVTGSAAAAGSAAARRYRATLSPEDAGVGYGGLGADGRTVLLEHVMSPAGQAPAYRGGWQEGTTIPAEYYYDDTRYGHDESYLRENFWWVVDHESRIPKPGDYFVYEWGRGDSLIFVRDQQSAVKAYHNVCRHRGSRLCLHGTSFDDHRPSEARPDGRPVDAQLSVMQLGSSGNTPVFRCPYHAWTYDLNGHLTSFPTGMPDGFNPAQHGLHPAHVRTLEGFIFTSLARRDPPDFDKWDVTWQPVAKAYGLAGTKVAARRSYPTKANWKLVVENFLECYHCQPSHAKSYTTAHYSGNQMMSNEQRERIEAELARHGHPVAQRGPQQMEQPASTRRATPIPTPYAPGMDMGRGEHLTPGYITASLDGKPVAPLLPGVKEWSHFRSRGGNFAFTTSALTVYSDYARLVRFTPRDTAYTDAEIVWLVNRDAKDEDVDINRLVALWDLTYREDRWLAENQQAGIRSTRYNFEAGQPYARTEGSPAGFVQWYMGEVVPAANQQTKAE
jgi:Rieske 2Fe-2S family protein